MAIADVLTLETPEQLRAVSDPFRQRLLGVFAEPMTVKAAAISVGAPLSRLYHHIDLLQSSGLIRVVSERRQRAAIERTFQAAARRFELQASALGGGAALARTTVEQILATDPAPRVARISLNLTPERLALLELKLADLLKVLETPDGVPTEILLVASPRPTGS